MDDQGLQEMRDALNVLRRALRDAYWSAANEQEGDRLTGLADWCADFVEELDADAIEDRTAAFEALKNDFARAKERLDKVKADIDTIVHRIEQAHQVAAAIDQVITLAAKYLAA